MRTLIAIIGVLIMLFNALGGALPADWGLLALLVAGILTLIQEFLNRLFPAVVRQRIIALLVR